MVLVMKRLFLLIPAAALAFAFSGCKKEEIASGEVQSVSSTYKALVWEYTATWCGPCGTTGYPTMHGILEDNKYKVCGVIVHPNDGVVDYEPAAQQELADFFDWSGTPDGGCNLVSQYPNSQLVSQVASVLNANGTAKAGIGISHTIEGNVMTIKTKTVFFSDVTGTYNLAVYVTEDDLMNTQTGQTGVVEHDCVFRGAVGGAWGTPVGVNPVKGTKVDGDYTFTIPGDVRNNANLKVVAVIYKMENGEPTAMLTSNKY